MLSREARDHATILRRLLANGELSGRDPVAHAPGAPFPFEVATSIALADLDHLTWLTEQRRAIDPLRWSRLAADLATLHDLAVPGR